jgi:hypothetical protein
MSTQTSYAGTVADLGTPSGGYIGWANPTNAEGASDGAYATANLTNSGGMPNTNASTTLSAGGLTFTIPGGATVNGISVTIRRYAGPLYVPSIRDLVVGITGGGTLATCTANYAVTGTDWPNSDASVGYGGPTDLWGASALAVTDINSGGMNVVLQVENTNTLFYIEAYVDAFEVTVHYTTAGGVTGSAAFLLFLGP